MSSGCKNLPIILSVCTFVLAGCSLIGGVIPTTTPTPNPPTATPEPAAARVNGEAIRLADLEEEIRRYETAKDDSGIDLATLVEYDNLVLQALIDRKLLAQGARQRGIVIETSELNSTLQDLATELGGNESMGVWLAEMGYTLDSFKSALEEDMLAAKMIELILQDVPENVEQVYARHILLASEGDAAFVLDQLAADADFEKLAQLYSRDASTQPAGGDLGWFPRGGLLFPEIENAAFELQPGEISGIVTSALGHHIVQTLEKAERPLSPNDLRNHQERAVEDWISSQRQSANIEVLITP